MELKEELAKEIHDFIEKKYCCKFMGSVKVAREDGEYVLWLTLDNWMTPLSIGLQTDDEDVFLEYIKKELTKRHFPRVGFFKMVQEHGKNQKR